MSLYLITGIAGSGKTTCAEELMRRGITAYDIDEGFAEWVHRTTGHTPGEVSSEERDITFQQNHDWKIIGKKVLEVAEQAKNTDIYMCGVADGMEDHYSLFSKMFYLDLSKETIVHRLKTRNGTSDYGKSDHELAATMKWYGKSQDLAREAGMTFINAEQSVEQVIDDVLGITESQ